jgi:hypothetical protein
MIGLLGLVLVAIGLQMMISGFSSWLVGPTVSYGPYVASSYELSREIQPSEVGYAWSDGYRFIDSDSFTDSWINFNVTVNDCPVNLYITRTSIQQADVSILNVTGSRNLSFRPPENGTYTLLIVNDSTHIAHVSISSALYVVGPQIDYSKVAGDLETAKQGLIIAFVGLLFSIPLFHRGLVWVYSLPGFLLGRRPCFATDKRTNPLVFILEVIVPVMIPTPVIIYVQWVEGFRQRMSSFGFAPNLTPALGDLGIRCALFYLLGIAAPFGLITFIALFSYQLLDSIIARLSLVTTTDIERDLRILADAFFRRNFASVRYFVALLSGFVLSSFLGQIVGTSSIVGLIFIEGIVLSYARYESLKNAASRLDYAWSKNIISTIADNLRFFFSALFAAAVLFISARYLVPFSVSLARQALLSRFVLWQFFEALKQEFLAAWGPPAVSSSLDALTNGVFFYWTLWLALWALIYAVLVPYMMGEKRLARGLVLDALPGIVLFVSIQATQAFMGITGIPALTSTVMYSVTGSLLLSLLKKSVRSIKEIQVNKPQGGLVQVLPLGYRGTTSFSPISDRPYGSMCNL